MKRKKNYFTIKDSVFTLFSTMQYFDLTISKIVFMDDRKSNNSKVVGKTALFA